MSKRSISRYVRRTGLSVIEVMFALGIAVFGLLGIASLLPLAGRNAGDSVRMAESQALAHRWYDDLLVSGAANPAQWVYYQDFTAGSVTPGFVTFSSLPTATTSYSTRTRFPVRQAVCIDPLFMSSRFIATQFTSFQQSSAPPAAHRWYRPTMFPYYLDSYNPVVDPAYTYGAQSTFALPDQPRMVRVTLGTPTLRISHRAARDILGTSDNMAISVSGQDATLPPGRVYTRGAQNSLFNAKMTSDDDYSWIATICPNDTLVNGDPVSSALMSVAVIYKRDLQFFDVSGPPTRIAGPEPEAKPQGELVFRVVPQYRLVSGVQQPADFQGGHGGTVTLVASDGVPDRIRSGDWIMLSKNRTAVGTTTVPVFRWFRIAAVEGEPQYTSSLSDLDVTAPTSGASPDRVWGRRVVLDGPDWDFDLPTGHPTQATYMPGTVAVYERVIPF